MAARVGRQRRERGSGRRRKRRGGDREEQSLFLLLSLIDYIPLVFIVRIGLGLQATYRRSL